MKIGILTLPLKTNYGGILQAYALQKHLKNEGHDTVLIDIKNKKPQYSLELKIKIFLYKLLNNKFYLDTEKDKVEQPLWSFNENYIQPKTQIIDTPQKLNDLNSSGFNAIIVGSDQVWRLIYTRELKMSYFLDFIDNNNIKRISYAASYGTDEWEDDTLIPQVKKLLTNFNAISVREDSGLKICNNIFDVQADHVLDPTMLISKEEYVKLFEKEKTPVSPGTLLEYILDPDNFKDSVSKKIEKLHNLIPFSVNGKDITKMTKSEIKNYRYPSVFSWIRGFYDADFVVTDSFHGTVFCIIFNKQFISIGNKKRGVTRFTSLLKKFNLEHRLILSQEDITDNLFSDIIDYNELNLLLESEREKSKQFLINSLI